MERATPTTVAGATYDVVVIGAGINGVAVARDAALRGLRVLVLDRHDLGSGTSAWSSRLIHGGLRYLEHGELRLVHESLRDREALFRIAGHLVTPLPFVVPVYQHNKKPGWMFRVGMYLYDALSLRKSVPRHRALGGKAVRVELPGLSREGLSGALRYYDGQVDFAERLVLETMLSAAQAGAELMTYAEVTDIVVDHARVTGVRAHDAVSGTDFAVRAAVVVNAAGAWVDELASPLGIERQIGGTKGTHLVVDPFPGAPETAVYYEARSDNRAILVIPWNGRYLIGTTDDRFTGDLDTVAGTEAERDYLLAETNALIPSAQLNAEDVLYTYAGIRPLPYLPDAAPGAIPRSHLILEHSGLSGLVSIVGGKLTPHLSLGEEVVDKIAQHLGRTLLPSTARHQRLPGAPDGEWASRAAELARTLPWPEPVRRRLLKVYGTRVQELLEIAAGDPQLAVLVGEGDTAIVAAEVALAVRAEAAVHLVDILHRRTMVGLEPGHAREIEGDVAQLAASMLGWDSARIAEEVEASRTYVRRFAGGVRGRQERFSA